MSVEGRITKKNVEELRKLTFDIAEIEHSFNTFGIVETHV